MMCECGAKFRRLHPDLNRCRCGRVYVAGDKMVAAKEVSRATSEVKKSDGVPSEGYHNKPGSALESLIPKWAVQEKEECSCKSMKLKMDRMGSVECSKRIEEIVQHLLQQDKKLIPVLQSVPKSLQRAAATKLVKKAIKLSEK